MFLYWQFSQAGHLIATLSILSWFLTRLAFSKELVVAKQREWILNQNHWTWCPSNPQHHWPCLDHVLVHTKRVTCSEIPIGSSLSGAFPWFRMPLDYKLWQTFMSAFPVSAGADSNTKINLAWKKGKPICSKFRCWCLVRFLICVCCFGKDWKSYKFVQC